ncbi:MAG: hypothetical protein WC792_01040 [Candidatus Micrarchaeia archaeon]|jgi:phosphomannomutase
MFKEYDVRGEYPTSVSEEKFYRLGQALSGWSDSLVLGRDYRKSGPSLASAIAAGFLQSEGGNAGQSREVMFLGPVPTPATAYLGRELGSQVTASHNPPQYNGAKFFRKGNAFSSSELGKVRKEFEKTEPSAQTPAAMPQIPALKEGGADAEAELKKYYEALPEFGNAVFDLCGGAACRSKHLFKERIFDAPDPLFERHSAEPKESTLGELKRKCAIEKKLGLAFDGDADRVIAVDKGTFIPGDVFAAFCATNFFKKGDTVVFSIDSSNEAFELAKNAGLKPVWSGVGDVNVLKVALDNRAVFAAEVSGHYSFMEHMAYSDALYAAARVSEVRAGEIAEFALGFKNTVLREEVYVVADFEKLKKLVQAEKGFKSIVTIDGVKAAVRDYCFLVRQSKTEPKIRISCEAESKKAAEDGMALAKKLVEKAAVG